MRSLTGFQIAPDVEKPVPVAELQAVRATTDAKLRTVGEHTGATLLDPLPDICGSGDGCLPFFGAGALYSQMTRTFARSSCGTICVSSIPC